ncbi:hypothetical protein GCM10011488_03790 [Steroidobacter agaridevorans]|nr:hypothetical protein GCM10011488_03790 [Steroidobacter agaridevorans]
MPQEFSRLARLFTTLAGLTVLAACGGGGGSGPAAGCDTGSTVTVSGKITFDRLVFSTTPDGGLNPNAPVESPARQVTVQAVSDGCPTVATTTDANGDYSLSVPANRNMFIRARAEMIKSGSAPTWTFAVRDNTSADAIYALDGSTFNTGTANVTRNLRAPSDWNGNGYSAGRRAAPFAILDTVYQAKQLILNANANADFPELNLFWSEDNKGSTDTFCPDTGDIGTSFYFRDSTRRTNDDCATPSQLPDGIYVLGYYSEDALGDTDEYDSHVIAHEFGHYFEDRFSRSDSIGGQHGLGDRLDLRVAFGEGWGNAFGSMSLNDPQYRDSSRGVSQDFGFNLESDQGAPEGWFSEASVGEILWDVFDSAADAGDNVALGFTPIYTVMTGEQVDTDALTSIYSFATALRSQNAGSAGAIADLLRNEDIDSTPDDFGTGESNAGGDIDPRALPIYDELLLGQQKTGVCSVSFAGSKDPKTELEANPNKLGNHRFFRFVNETNRLVTIRAQGAARTAAEVAATDPDIYVLRRGEVVLAGTSTGTNVETISGQQLAAGTYIIDVSDFDTTGINQPPRCMTLSITGS